MIVKALSIGLILIAGCLGGCQIQPLPAHKLFGTSNPSMRMNVPGYGSLAIPTDFKGKFKIDKSPDGAMKIDITIDSKASEVVDAEGNRIPNMDAGRQIEATMQIESKRIDHETLRALLPEALSFLRSLIPAPAAPATPVPTEPEPAP